MAKMTVKDLTNALVMDSYTPRTDEELKSAAENRYNSVYDQKRLTAQQNYQTSDQAYQQQLKQLQDTLASNQQELLKNVQDSIASADRYTITRGMQRSSYGAANRANIQGKGQQSLAALLKQYSTDAGGIESNRTLLARQLADTLAQYDIDYQNDVLAYIDEQKQLDYDRKVAADQYANQLQMQLFEYNQKYGGGGGGGGSRRSYTSSGQQNDSGDNGSAQSLWNSLNQQNIYKTYNLNPTFSKANQTTSGKTVVNSNQSAMAKAVGTATRAKKNAVTALKSKANSVKK